MSFCHECPRYIICDQHGIFDCDAFRHWVKGKGIKPPRYGAIGQHGSIAVVERAIRTIKDEATRRILVPLRRDTFSNEMLSYADWHNEHRPHTTLEGRTPNEVYFGRHPVIAGHASNLGRPGLAVRPVPGRKRSSPAKPEIASPWTSSSMLVGDICPSSPYDALPRSRRVEHVDGVLNERACPLLPVR